MLIKCETKSARVKGLSFHPKRRWLLASLHNGVIQLWDYSEKTMIDRFDEHKGPVRGLDFHRHQPLFVSGGDDSKIKVWNYKSRRCLFTLDAHEDYIRTTYFHHEHPWILSTSDDQSIRIWNWQSRSRIAVLTGHTHYVMCAQFHPSMELILSASIDQTLRLWDITGLKMKNASSSVSSKEEISSGLPEILSKTDYSVESKDAHNSEINWCCFHPDPSKRLCLSAADDNYIKIWRLDSRNGLDGVDTLRGHYNNVNCAIFHPRKDLVLSASEDRSIRVWDLEKRSSLSTHRKEVDRYWAIAAHPNENLFAAGHDTGLMVFKLERERPAFTVVRNIILFIRGRQLLKYDMDRPEAPERVLVTLKPKTELVHHYHKLHCYSYDDSQTNQILVSVRSTNIEKSIYDLYRISSNNYSSDNTEPIRSQGLAAIFIGPSKYAVLDKSKKVIFKVNDQEKKSKISITADEIFDAGPNRLFVKSKAENTISLWDFETATEISSLKVDAKFVIMSQNKSHVACVGSHRIVICDGQLNMKSTIDEQRKIKSAVLDESGVLIYNTQAHIKYALISGETTTLLSVKQTLYLISFRLGKLFCMDRRGDIKQIHVDRGSSREFKFKQAVSKGDRSAILESLRQLPSLTRAEISFLVKKGYPGLALKFVKDDHTRFPLALQAFDIDVALDAANRIDNKRCWEQLAEAAMQVGHLKAAERSLWKLKSPYKLAMLYLCANQRDKMLEARALANELGDTSTEYIISLLVKDFAECAQIIRRRGQVNLAHTFAVNHGLYELARELREEHNISENSEEAHDKVDWMKETIHNIGNAEFTNWLLLNDKHETYEPQNDIMIEEARGDWSCSGKSNSSLESLEDQNKLNQLNDEELLGSQDDLTGTGPLQLSSCFIATANPDNCIREEEKDNQLSMYKALAIKLKKDLEKAQDELKKFRIDDTKE